MWERCDEARPPAGQDPDVVGLGTLIACAGSASIAVLCLIVQYLFFYLPRGEDEQQPRASNPIDVLLVGWLRKPLRYLGIRANSPATLRQRERRWPAALDRYVLALGDVQLAMGFAMLAYGYASLIEQGLSMYHWWLIVGLVWFSVVTNLATTSYLRTYFVNRDPGERWWRIILLIFLVVVLSFSMVPIYQIKERLANEHDEDVQRRIILTTNVLCYFPGHGAKFDTPHFRSGVTLVGIVVGVGLALFGVLRIYERPRSVIFKWRDHYRGEMERSFFGDGDNIITCIRCEQRHLLLVVRPVLALWLVLRLYADLLNSVLTEIICAAATFTWVVVRFIDVLRLGGTLEIDSHHWNFGQIVALAFFAAPLGSLASCLCGIIGRVRFSNDIFKCPKLQKPRWLQKLGKTSEPEQISENETDHHSIQPESERTEETNGLAAKDPTETVENNHEEQGLEERTHLESGVDDLSKSIDYVNTYKVLLSPRFIVALPVMGFSNLLHLVLLLLLPKVPGYPSPPDVLWRTIFWYLVYQPLLLFAFFLAGMVVEERVTNEGRMRVAYSIIAAVTAVLSTAAILDTLYGLGGIPMSYIGMGALGLVLLVYLLYGCVARPGPLAKGKGRRNGDIEEAQPLLGGTLEDVRRRFIPEIRIFPVRRPKRWHGPSRRPQATRGRRGYGTID
ncbi:uncharacterized protein GGS22DRAFT_170698 [Annulohypoxylon maeteangense]|uniref:uncharacterized protein n=1 Tax=Annulohypoxylon maeteangense TaxID=1927788 RepID=UPI0020084A58|nr:uncharacterized protein GGS22DRAFT_170698 [Annulohypoxylon maeteangense]KAI0882328.1 hypothetical protein GGS22DRAFT_170698 [Annulohypoxylon maeteangense]